MKKIINYFKNLVRKFTSQSKACERYILNKRYSEDVELIKFVRERQRTLGKSSIPFVITLNEDELFQTKEELLKSL